jgi:S1-C subfamily serine protease
MMRHWTFAAAAGIALAVSGASASAQSGNDTDTEALRTELTEARAELEKARQQLEQAARGVAVATAVPGLRSLSSDGSVYFVRRRTQLGLTLEDSENGAHVLGVVPGSAAAQAGVRVGDVIRSVDGEPLEARDQLRFLRSLLELENARPGETVRLGIERDGEQVDLDVEPDAASSTTAATAPRAAPLIVNGNVRLPQTRTNSIVIAQDGRQPSEVLGSSPTAAVTSMLRTFSIATSPWSDMELVPMTEALGRYFGTAEGLLVVRGPASDAIDIGDGDVILSINGRTPSSPEHALRILGSYEPGETIEFSIMRDRQRLPIEYLVPTDSRLGTPAGTLWRAP